MQKDIKKYPRVGIGVMLKNSQGEVLLGLRKGSHASGEWSFPGGHLEFRETVFETAKREVKEETGLEIKELKLISVADERRYIETDAKHYLNIGVEASYLKGEPEIREPDKCEKWQWFSLNALPEKIMEGTELILRNYQKKQIYQEG